MSIWDILRGRTMMPKPQMIKCTRCGTKWPFGYFHSCAPVEPLDYLKDEVERLKDEVEQLTRQEISLRLTLDEYVNKLNIQASALGVETRQRQNLEDEVNRLQHTPPV